MGEADLQYLVGKHIVVVDDDKMLRDVLTGYYEVNNTVVAFEGAEDCLKALASFATAPDVFIIDYFLPGMHGIDLFKQIRPLYPQSKMVLMTGYLSPEMAEQGLHLGFDSLILKPFDFRILEQNIIDLFNK